MKILVSWLREFVDIDETPEALADRLTGLGFEVEAVVRTARAFDRVVVGEVVGREPVGGDERLLLCRVNLGDRTVESVCGDPGVEVGQRSPVALPGAVLATGATVAATEMGGRRSDAVLCSLFDLGLRSVQDRVYRFEGNPGPGSPAAPLLGLDDVVLEIELTPNRGDCMSILGMAREVAAATARRVRLPERPLAEAGKKASVRASIAIEAPDLCPLYVGRVVESLRVEPSPLWLARRLRLMGLRPINNVVDAANYVMLEVGQPLHTFDLARLAGSQIVVRKSRGEAFTALDGSSHELAPETLVIADARKPVAVAGVVGGVESGVGAGTGAVLIESACFEAVAVRRAARRMGLSTDASMRFERGIDPAGVERAADRLAALLAEVAGGTVLAGRVVAGKGPAPRSPVTLRPERANRQLGLSLESSEMEALLAALGFGVTRSGPALEAVPPSYRNDVSVEVDLYEEIARLYGFGRIPSGGTRWGGAPAGESHRSLVLARVRSLLSGVGLDEAVTATLWDPETTAALGRAPEGTVERLRLRNPVSLEQSVLRPSLVPGLIVAVRLNLNRRRTGVRLFEIGTVFQPGDSSGWPLEETRLAVAATGPRTPGFWEGGEALYGFYDLKGHLEDLFHGLRLGAPILERDSVPTLDPASAVGVRLGPEAVGVAGCLEPGLAARCDLKEAVWVFELVLDKIMNKALPLQQFNGLPRFPAVTRDLAVVVEEGVRYERVREVVEAEGRPLLEEVRLFDVYRGKPVPADHKSLACSLIFRSRDRTLRDEEVDETVVRIIGALGERLKARLRSEA